MPHAWQSGKAAALSTAPKASDLRRPNEDSQSQVKDRRFHRNRRMLTPASIRARWIEGEAFRLLRLGFSYRQIAGIITALGAGDLRPEVAGTEVPADVTFPEGYCISYVAVYKLVKRALEAYPTSEIREYRKLWAARLEETWSLLYPAMRKGNTRAIEVGMKVAQRAAKLTGLDLPAKAEVPEEPEGIPLKALRALMARVDAEKSEPIDEGMHAPVEVIIESMRMPSVRGQGSHPPHRRGHTRPRAAGRGARGGVVEKWRGA